MNIIAHMESPFGEKFGIPRQAGVVAVQGTVVFEPRYRQAEAVRGLEGFDYIWLIWLFSAARREGWSATVRPPRLGGNERVGVFASRSPFRPNPVGLSCVRLAGVELSSARGPLLHVEGADLMDGTPIVDIKPYLPYTDAHPDARSGFAPHAADRLLEVRCAEEMTAGLADREREVLKDVLAHDPRPRYHADPRRVYGMRFGEWEVRFKVEGDVLTVVDVAGVKV